MPFVPMFPVYVNFTLHVLILSVYLVKNDELSVSALSAGDIAMT